MARPVPTAMRELAWKYSSFGTIYNIFQAIFGAWFRAFWSDANVYSGENTELTIYMIIVKNL